MALALDDTRRAMKSYWEEHSANTSIETMMLDSNARTLHALEHPEILKKAPNMEGKDVLELAAGIGRYTSLIGQRAKSVVAVEFIEDFHKANKAANGHHDHITFLCQDVCELECEPHSFDVIFSNWIFMYLSDDEVKRFAQKAVKWLRPGGKLFFRESCFRPSGDAKRSANPTNYRLPSFYVDAFGAVVSEEPYDMAVGVLQLEAASTVAVYREVKQNDGQVCFSYVKQVQKGPRDALVTRQKLLDEQEFATKCIARLDQVPKGAL